jgi:RHS repeat-associated protein
MRHIILTVAVSLAATFSVHAQDQDNPGWLQTQSLTPEEVVGRINTMGIGAPHDMSTPASPPQASAQAAANSPGATMSLGNPTPTAGGNEADEITPEIAALARGLRYDPVTIFGYVHNHIEFESYYGCKKGAHLTLLEGSGNDFDQSALLVALLRASGKNPSYKYGACSFSYATMTQWMGLSPSPFSHMTDQQFSDYYGGLPATTTNRKFAAGLDFFFRAGYYISDPFLYENDVWFTVPHVWVEITDGGLTSNQSPSFKFHDDLTGIDLASAMGYSPTERTAFLGAAAGSVSASPDSVTSLNYANIATRLANYSQTLGTYLRNNEHELDVDLVTGTRRIQEQNYYSFVDVDPLYTWSGCPWLALQTWSAIPVEQMSKLRIQCGTYNYTAATPSFTTTLFDQTVNMPGLKGRKISLAWAGNTASIRLDETLLGSSFTVTGPKVDIQLKASHNHYTKQLQGTTYVDSGFGRHNQSETKSYLKGNTYAYSFVYSFDNPDKLSKARQEILDGYRRDNLAESDWRVRTEVLNIMGLQWFFQTWRQSQVTASQFNTLPMSLHRFGRVAQEQSFYIDVGLQFSVDINRNQDFALEGQFFGFKGFVSSAMEHGVIEQMQGEDQSATSTVKMIHLANQQAIPIYRTKASNWSTVKPLLVNYSGQVTSAGHFLTGVQYRITTKGTTNFTLIGASSNTVGTYFFATGPGTGTGTATPTGLDDLEKAITSATDPGTALVPKNGQITLNQWKGYGYAIEQPSSSFMKISGGNFGGYNSQTGFVSAEALAEWSASSPAYMSSGTTNQSVPYTPYTTPMQYSKDPVDMLSGAFVLDKTELTVGSGGSPRGLAFSRHYNSNRRYDKSAGLGYGWTHNYDITATKRSSVTAGLAGTISYHATPFLAAMQVAADLYKNHSNAKEWATSALVVNWAIDQLKYNAVAVTLGNRTIEFIRLPDGSYEPPAGMNLTLASHGSGAGEYFTMTERHGPTYTFNSSGQIATITDLWAQTQNFTYTAGLLTGVSDSYGRAFTFTRPSGRITSVSDQNSRSIIFGYTGDDLTSCSDVEVEGKSWSYGYTDHLLTQTKDPSNRIIAQNTYDSKGRVSEQFTFGDPDKKYSIYYAGYWNTEENPDGGRTIYTYDSRGRATATIDPLGNRTDIYYDGHDRKIHTLSPENEKVDFYHDKNNNLTTVTDPINLDAAMTYDSQNRIQTITDKRGNVTTVTLYNAQHQPLQVAAPLARTTSYTYTASGELDTTTDAEGNITDNNYNGLGQLTQILVNGQTIASYTYNSYGDIATSGDALGRTTTYTYNKRRQLLTTTLPAIPGQPAAVIVNTYDNEGMLASSADANGNTTSHTYFASGNPHTSTAPAIPVAGGGSLANTVTHSYNVRDLLETTVNSLGHTASLIYDDASRLTEARDPLNRATLTSYDADSRPTQSTDPLLRVTGNAYTLRGEPLTRTDALSKDTGFLHDENGNQTRITNRRGKAHNFTYDLANRLTDSATPSGKNTHTAYFKNDLVKTITEPSGDLTTLAYDTRLRLQTKTDPAGSVAYGYNSAGELLTVTENSVTITRTYDERGRLKTFTSADGDLLQYQYDASNNLTRLTYPPDAAHPAGKQVNYTYNARNLLETVTDWSNRVTTYQYDRLGRLTGITRPNGTSNQIAHDAANQLISIKESAGGKLFSYLSFTHDAAGQVKSRFQAPLVTQPWQQPTFSATYDDDNRLASVNGTTVTHDADGNMTYGPIRSDSGNINLSYNSRNQLTNAPGISYTYDSEGRRRSLTDSSGVTRDVIAPGGQLLIRHHPDTTKTYYVYGLGLLYEANEADATKTYHFDQVGSTIARTNDAGSVIGRSAYSAYGLITSKEGDMATPFLYNGQAGVQTDSNGLLNMRARYYSPYLMRFLNSDPSGFSGGSNWFAYADGNPISLSDPFGLCAEANSCTGGYGKGSQIAGYVGYVLDEIDLVPSYIEENGADSVKRNFTDPKFVAISLLSGMGMGGITGGISRTAEEISITAETTLLASLRDASGGLKGIETNVTANEFAVNIQSNGYTATTTMGNNGPVTVLQNGQGSTWTIYTRTSTGASGAQYVGPNGQLLKYNLGK